MDSFDDERKSRPSTSRTVESTEVIQKYLVEDRTSSVRMLQELTGINIEAVRRSNIWKVSGKCVLVSSAPQCTDAFLHPIFRGG
jgi:hypothetical protein